MEVPARDPAQIRSVAAKPRFRIDKKMIAAYGFLSPALLFFSIFFVFPIGFSIYITFFRWNMLRPVSQAQYMGWDHYIYLLTEDPAFWLIFRNTVVFSLGTVLAGSVVALLIAFVFSRSRYKSIWRTIYWLPVVTTVVAIAWLWRFLLDPVYGLVNTMLRAIGIGGPNWLDNPNLALYTVILVATWAGMGFSIIIYSAGLEGIPEELYEAARIDGANVFGEFRHVTIPMLKPTLLFVMVTGFIGALGNFALIMVMTGGGPVHATNVLALYMYETAFQSLRMGRASAMAFILFLVVFVVTLIQLRIFRHGGVESY